MTAPESIKVLHKKRNVYFDVFPLEDNCLMFPYRLTPEGYSTDLQSDTYLVIDETSKEIWDGRVQAVYPHTYLVEISGRVEDEKLSYNLVQGDFILVRVARQPEEDEDVGEKR